MAREKWAKQDAFIMAAIGSAIGLGNVWRFPYMAYSNGGGAFFIPYIVALITAGIPLLALEYYLGIYYQTGPTKCYAKIHKKAGWIGNLSLGASFMITVYYCVIMAWVWKYLYYSFNINWAGKEKLFFYEKTLNLSESISTLGGIQWPLVLGLFLTWLFIYLIIFKGLKVVSKVINWTVGLPWVIILILLIRGVTLPGAFNGLEFYLNPQFSKLLEPSVWLAAYGQIFFSLSLGFGIMVAYSSYLPKNSDIATSAWVVSFANSLTSFFAGFAIFSALGYLATLSGTPVSEVIKSGPGFAFIVYPSVISTLPGGPIAQATFGFSFFLMLLLLGIDSAFSLTEAITTGLRDSFGFKREWVCFWVCLAGFLGGSIYVTSSGLYWLDIVDHWMNWILVFVGLFEAILIGYFCDVKEVARFIDNQSKIKIGKLWIFSIKYLTPFVLILTLGSNIFNEIKTPYGGYPLKYLVFGGWGSVLFLTIFAFVSHYWQSIKRSGRHALSMFSLLSISIIGLLFSIYRFYQSTEVILMASIIFLGAIALFGIFLSKIFNQEVQA